jgi:hypothetical protein
MIIETNKKSGGDSFHDLIKYTSIEKQLFDLLLTQFDEVIYEFDRKFINFYVGEIRIMATIKGSVKLDFISMNRSWNDGFEIKDSGEHNAKRPSVSLKFNVDITKPLKQFADKIKEIQNLKNKAKPMFDKVKKDGPALHEAMEKYLNEYFGNQYLEVKSWLEPKYFFNGLGLGFYIKPIGQAPADGIYLMIEEDGTLDNFWNNSSQRRTSFGGRDKIEDAYSRVNFGDGIPGMKSKIEAIEDLQKKVEEFDLNKCSEMVKLVALKKEANKIKEELSKI